MLQNQPVKQTEYSQALNNLISRIEDLQNRTSLLEGRLGIVLKPQTPCNPCSDKPQAPSSQIEKDLEACAGKVSFIRDMIDGVIDRLVV